MVTGSPVLQGKIRCTFEALYANSAGGVPKISGVPKFNDF